MSTKNSAPVLKKKLKKHRERDKDKENDKANMTKC